MTILLMGKLKAPAGYWSATQVYRGSICNGCGPDGWKGIVIPDTIWGLKITSACNIHDWMYHFGIDEGDKREADLLFLENMQSLIASSWKWLRKVRHHRAIIYYLAVSKLGDAYFNPKV